MGNPVVHFEMGAADDRLLVAFYGGLFDWDMQNSGAGGYTMIDTRGGLGINGGIGRSQSGEPWATFYVETDDPQATLDKANALGGTTVMPVTDLGGAMTIAMFNDPDGLVIGLVQAAAAPASPAPVPSAGSGEAVTWFEIFGSDAARTQQFYAGVFGWTVDNSGFPDYAVVDTGVGRGLQQGGIGGGQESRWATVYAKVASVQDALSRAEKLGGSRICDPGVAAVKTAARLARYGGTEGDVTNDTFRDPAGNIFGVFNY
jgi:uncharacterized protein